MNNELKEVLNLVRLPARMNIVQVAACLGFKPHDLPILVAHGLLKPLGRPAPSSEKYFSRKKSAGTGRGRRLAVTGHGCPEPALAGQECPQIQKSKWCGDSDERIS